MCVSLWKVDDAPTALLMDRFYQNVLGRREGLNTEALRFSINGYGSCVFTLWA
jgi:CHAT domain-containing protein